MREILFKGKTLKTHRWVYGGHHTIGNRQFIINTTEFELDEGYNGNIQCAYRMYEVDPNSVGQYTGQVDQCGEKIFEGDIVYVPAEDEYANVDWDEPTSRFILNFDCWCCCFDHFYGYELEVAGNTFDEGWFEANG